MISVLEGHEALRHLEEVAIGLVRCKVNIEDEFAIRFNFLLSGSDLEWILDKLICRFVQDL